jgi:hypothetical protein
VEIKTPAGELSELQQSVMAAVLASGGPVGVVRNAEEMLGLQAATYKVLTSAARYTSRTSTW